jgi:spermidine synthase
MKKQILLSVLLGTQAFSTTETFHETLYPSWGQTFAIDELLFKDKTEHQDLILFKNNDFGTTLALDGAIQLTQKDEFVYHEMLVQVPFFTHGQIKKVLVVGGGDGGIIREVLRHKQVERVVLVELDRSVVEFSKKHLPFLSQGAFDDPRLEVVIQDGMQYVNESSETFDLVICDSPDPIGEAKNLFTYKFYKGCHDRLNPGGVFVNHVGVPLMQPEEIIDVNKSLKQLFKEINYYFVAVPTYVGGVMGFTFASDAKINTSLETLQERYAPFKDILRYYTPEVHLGAFAMPKFIQDMIKDEEQ